MRVIIVSLNVWNQNLITVNFPELFAHSRKLNYLLMIWPTDLELKVFGSQNGEMRTNFRKRGQKLKNFERSYHFKSHLSKLLSNAVVIDVHWNMKKIDPKFWISVAKNSRNENCCILHMLNSRLISTNFSTQIDKQS